LWASDRQVVFRTATVAALTALAILLCAHYAGELLLTALGASLASFQIGGGLIVLLIGLTLVQGQMAEVAESSAQGGGASTSALPFHIGVTPLGTPALAGAASITAVILETHEEHGLRDDIMITLIIILVAIAAWAVLACAPAIGRLLGRNGLLVLQRVFGLIIVAIGVEIIVAGLSGHWAKLA
jgi:multiple antibiotic resistance protein